MALNRTPERVKVELGDLTVDPRVQQPLVESRVREMLARGFDKSLLGVITVSVRESEGSTEVVVLDGQHRTEAARRSGYMESIIADAYYGLTLSEEAYLFVYLNKKANPSALSKFQARTVAGEDVPVAITETLGQYGWKVQNGKAKATNAGKFSAVNKAESIYRSKGTFKSKHPGSIIFDRTIRVATDAWGMDASSVSGDIISGIALVLIRYHDEVKVSDLIKSLAKTTPSLITAEAVAIRKTTGMSRDEAFGWRIHQEYNRGRRQRNRLTPWT